MKILYGIQGTGNGHISRALEIIPGLQKRGEVDLLISGNQSELQLPYEVKYKFNGLGFVFGKKGGIDYVETYRKSRLKQFFQEVSQLNVEEYDLVISDFEPVTAWACIRKGKKCVGLSNQVSLLMPEVPTVHTEDFFGRFIIRNYAPCAINFGFSYAAYGKSIYTPVIRQSIRDLTLSNEGHYVVYLPAFSDEKIIATLSLMPDVDWRVFSKTAKSDYTVGNVQVYRLNKELFEKTLASCKGVMSAAGFGTTTEALFMGKKLLVVPQKRQYEQACNALALAELGIPVIKSIKAKHLPVIENWVNSAEAVHVDYPDLLEKMLDDIIATHHQADDAYMDYLTQGQFSLAK